MINGWREAKSWDASKLRDEGTDSASAATKLDGSYEAAISLQPPLWLGDAANAERADRDLMAERMQQLGEALRKVAEISSDAGSTLSTIQQDQRSLESRLTSAGWSVSDDGALTRPAPTPGVPSAQSTGEGEVAAVFAIQQRTRQLDDDTARRQRELASALAGADDKLHLVDLINTYQLQFVDGALDGATWDLDWERDLPSSIDWGDEQSIDTSLLRHELLFALDKGGYPPRWLLEYLYDGRIPTDRELLSFRLFHERVERGLEDGNPGYFDDGSPFAPEVRPAQDPVEVKDVSGLMKAMAKVYEYPSQSDPTDRGAVEVRVVEGSPPRFLAVVPGTTPGLTSSDAWGKNPEGTDWAADVKLMGFGQSSGQQSAQAAIDLAIQQEVARYEAEHGPLTQKPKVTLAGHSQGGIIATRIAGDRFFHGRYDVEEVVSVGAPIDNVQVPPGTRVTSLVNPEDIVAPLDEDVAPQSNMTKITFHLGDKRPDGLAPHELGHHQATYQQRIDAALAGQGRDATTNAQVQALNQRLSPYFVDGQKVQAVTFGRR